MTLIQLLQEFAARAALPIPTTFEGEEDAQVRQLGGLLNEGLDFLTKQFSWEFLIEEAVFSTTAAEDQGPISTLAPLGFISLYRDTIYNRTTRLPAYGPVTGRRWQEMQALPISGPLYQYRIRGGNLWLIPAPQTANTLAFEYKSGFSVLDAESTRKQYFTLDTDTSLFPDDLLLAYLRMSYRREKGLEYLSHAALFEQICNKYQASSGVRPVLSMDLGYRDIVPSIGAPPGNWNVS